MTPQKKIQASIAFGELIDRAAALSFLVLVSTLSACGGGSTGSQTGNNTVVPVGVAPGSGTPVGGTPPTGLPAPSPIAAFSTSVLSFNGFGSSISLDASSSTPGSGALVDYRVDWGDGTTNSNVGSALFKHNYTKRGAYSVTLTVADILGKTGAIAKALTVLTASDSGNEGGLSTEIPETNQVVSLHTEIVVPLKPDPVGVIAVWPGLLPAAGKTSYAPVGFGLLQPILVFGGVGCEVTSYEQSHWGTWWVEGYYYNDTEMKNPNPPLCGGGMLSVSPGDTLKMDMVLNGEVWTQTITDATLNKTVSFSKNLHGQAQNLVQFYIEYKGQTTGLKAPAVFSNTIITLAMAQSGDWCNPGYMGAFDAVTAPIISADTKNCTIKTITLTPGAKTFNSAP